MAIQNTLEKLLFIFTEEPKKAFQVFVNLLFLFFRVEVILIFYFISVHFILFFLVTVVV